MQGDRVLSSSVELWPEGFLAVKHHGKLTLFGINLVWMAESDPFACFPRAGDESIESAVLAQRSPRPSV